MRAPYGGGQPRMANVVRITSAATASATTVPARLTWRSYPLFFFPDGCITVHRPNLCPVTPRQCWLPLVAGSSTISSSSSPLATMAISSASLSSWTFLCSVETAMACGGLPQARSRLASLCRRSYGAVVRRFSAVIGQQARAGASSPACRPGTIAPKCPVPVPLSQLLDFKCRAEVRA